MDLNETDLKILKGLLADARFSSRQIAKNVGVSVGTVLSRIKRMEDEGIIKGYSLRRLRCQKAGSLKRKAR
jgi:DNA-binding Lrp family transcriptional regulator